MRLSILGFISAIALSAAAAEFKVGLVLDRGGKDDKSFNSSAFDEMPGKGALNFFGDKQIQSQCPVSG